MARINIEESLFKDVRFDDLKMKLGSVDTALGAMVRAWSLAQQWYLKEETDRLIPITEWKKQRINNAIIEVGLAEIKGEFVYVCGSNEQFSWLVQKREAGKKSGESRRSKNKEEKTVEQELTDVEHPLTCVNGSEPLSLSLSPSPSPSPSLSTNSNSFSNSSTGEVKEKPNTELNKKIWESYSEAYLQRWKVEPVRNASVNGKISQLGKRLGSEAVEVVKFYLTHNSSFYLTQMHPIGLCLKDAEGLRTQMLRGRAITTTDVREFEKQDHYTQQLKRLSEEI